MFACHISCSSFIGSTCTSSFFFQDILGTRWDITGVSFGFSERCQLATSSYGAGFTWGRDGRTTATISISCNGRNIHRHDKWPLCVTVLCTGSQARLNPSVYRPIKKKGIASPRYSRRAVFLKLSATRSPSVRAICRFFFITLEKGLLSEMLFVFTVCSQPQTKKSDRRPTIPSKLPIRSPSANLTG